MRCKACDNPIAHPVWSKKLGDFDPFCGTCKAIAGRSVPKYWVDENNKAQYFTPAPFTQDPKFPSQVDGPVGPTVPLKNIDHSRPLGYDDSWIGFYNYLQNACGAGDDEHGLLEEATSLPRGVNKEDELY